CGEGILRLRKIFEAGRRETKVTLPGETKLAGQFPDPLDVGVEDTESVTHAGPGPLPSLTFRWPFARRWRDTLTAGAPSSASRTEQ
ncbi:hypothetical protein KUCAC02_010721, partial [Chaenocephalus aceratus]